MDGKFEAAGRVSICNQPWNTLYVAFDGKAIRPCCYGPHDLGDLNTATIQEIWNGPLSQTCRETLFYGQLALDVGRWVGICPECLTGIRIFNDHINPFAGALERGVMAFNERKLANFRRAEQSYRQGKIEVDHWPYFIYLDLSSKCNIRCRKCYVYGHQQVQPPVGHMLRSVFDRVAPYLPYAIRVVCTGNGEAVLHPDFREIMEILGRNECQISFNTSGNPLTPELSQAAVDLGVHEIIFSIDSLDEDLYAYHHRGGSLSRVMENLEAICRRKLELKNPRPILLWFFVGMKSTLHELPEMLRRAAELGFQALYMERLITADAHMKSSYKDYYARENLVSTPEDLQRLREAVEEAQELAAALGVGFTNGYASLLAKAAA